MKTTATIGKTVIVNDLVHIITREGKNVQIPKKEVSREALELMQQPGNYLHTIFNESDRPSYYVQRDKGMPVFVSGPDLHRPIEPKIPDYRFGR